jgi:hypothetical protein
VKHTRKHERRKEGIEPKSKTARLWRTVVPGEADCPHEPRGLSGLLPRTVRTRTADRPALSRGLFVKANRTSSSEPRKTDRPRGARGLSARHPRTVRPTHEDRPKPRPTKTRNHNGSKTRASKNMKNTRRTAKLRTVRYTLADCSCLADRAENCSTSKVNTSNPSPDLPKGRSC